MVVRGSCSCSGHAESCVPKINDGVVVTPANQNEVVYGNCACKHNTVGSNCERCAPFYQDVPWKPGQGTSTNECKSKSYND